MFHNILLTILNFVVYNQIQEVISYDLDFFQRIATNFENL